MNQILELLGIVKPIVIKILDNSESYRLSYIKGIKQTNENHHIECSSEVLFSMLKYEYGWDSIKISGRFNFSKKKEFLDLGKFFFFQNRLKNGQTLKNIGELSMYLLQIIKEKVNLKPKKI